MVCPKCKSNNVAVLKVDKDMEVNNTSNYRYYICKECNHEFKRMIGYSSYNDASLKKGKKNGSR